MKIIEELPSDSIYMWELKEIAEFYNDTLEFALKQAISIQHSKIKGFEDALEIIHKKEEYETNINKT